MAPDRGSETIKNVEILTQEVTTLTFDPPPVVSAGATMTAGDSFVNANIANASLPPHLSHDPLTNGKRTDPFQFGHRYLAPTDDVFEYNAWDHVVPDAEHEEYCQEQYEKQRSAPVSDFDKSRFNTNPEKWWDLFYKQKTSTFFKDRKWLFQEFSVLKEVTTKDAGPKVVLEVGAGAGNTAFPVLRANENDQLMVHAYDFSKKAVETMRNADEYDEKHMRAEVWDVASGLEDGTFSLPPGIEANSVDVVILIFIFSALSPLQWAKAVENVYGVLKPGGEVLFRDYGRGDLAQVRFKAGRWMEDNFYVRGDGTRVYFFEKEQLEDIWGGSPRQTDESRSPHFEILNLDIDRRLIVNRQRKLKMFRCWIQGRFRKPQGETMATESTA
jgi:tRNAThr (cytosine32-N3)-methyltransferase